MVWLYIKFKNHQVTDRNWFVLEVLWFFFSYLGKCKTVPAPAQIYLKYFISAVVTLFYLFENQEYLKNWEEVSCLMRILFEKDIAWTFSCLTKKIFLKNLARRKLLDPLYISKGNTGFAGFLRNVNCWKIMLCNMNKAAKSTDPFLVLDR